MFFELIGLDTDKNNLIADEFMRLYVSLTIVDD